MSEVPASWHDDGDAVREFLTTLRGMNPDPVLLRRIEAAEWAAQIKWADGVVARCEAGRDRAVASAVEARRVAGLSGLRPELCERGRRLRSEGLVGGRVSWWSRLWGRY